MAVAPAALDRDLDPVLNGEPEPGTIIVKQEEEVEEERETMVFLNDLDLGQILVYPSVSYMSSDGQENPAATVLINGLIGDQDSNNASDDPPSSPFHFENVVIKVEFEDGDTDLGHDIDRTNNFEGIVTRSRSKGQQSQQRYELEKSTKATEGTAESDSDYEPCQVKKKTKKRKSSAKDAATNKKRRTGSSSNSNNKTQVNDPEFDPLLPQPQIECGSCDKLFLSPYRLANHKCPNANSNKHNKPFSCSVCKREFRWKLDLVRHLRTHTGERPYLCSMCPKSFPRKAHLIDHERTHSTDRPFTCSVCHRSFKQFAHMSHHKKSHSVTEDGGDTETIICSLCNKTFSDKKALRRHDKVHHSQKAVENLEEVKVDESSQGQGDHFSPDPQPQEVNLFQCDLCPMKCLMESLLIAHKRKHTGELPRIIARSRAQNLIRDRKLKVTKEKG